MSTTVWFRGITTKSVASRVPVRTSVAHAWNATPSGAAPMCGADVYAPVPAEWRNETHVPKCLRCTDRATP